MKIALISDIHGNFDALTAVFEDIDRQGDIESVYCLGDIVGYGPEPEACADLVRRRCEVTLMGNHDFAMLHSTLGFNPIAAVSIEYTTERLSPGPAADPVRAERWAWFRALPERWELGEDLLVHASPRDNLFEYLLPDDALYDPKKIAGVMRLVARNVFIGHTHRPGILTAEPRFLYPSELGMAYDFRPGEKLIVNVSSVGQPRDRDPRACYATVTEDGVAFRRVPYDIEATVRKVLAIPEIDARCGLRLREGR
ncbi:MAG: metallophosphoesterase [Planctomycetota bacterium]